MSWSLPAWMLFAFLIANATADATGQHEIPTGHLRKSDPDELYVAFFEESECGVSLETILESELAQSRMKRKEFWNYNELLLYVRIRCLPLDRSPPRTVYSIEIEFGEFTYPTNKQKDEYSFLETYYEPDFGTFGITSNDEVGRQFFRNGFRESLERALLAYLKVNFDL